MTPNNISIEKQNELCRKWDGGTYNGKQLATEFGLDEVCTRNWLKKKGYKMKSQTELRSIYSLDELYFDVINSEEKAYFLGYLFADGSNDIRTHKVNLTQAEKDKETLYKFNSAIKSNRLIRSYPNKYSGVYYYVLNIVNKHFSLQLEKLGCIRAKTFKLTFPKYLDKSLYRHFIRGYFDGDGCMTGASFSIVGTELFLESIQQIFIDKLGLSKTQMIKRHPENNNNITSIRYTGWKNISLLYKYLYEDSSIYLNRKKKKFESLLDSYDSSIINRRSVIEYIKI